MMLEAGLNSVDITPYLVEEYWFFRYGVLLAIMDGEG